MNYHSMGKRIRRKRLEKGWTQEKMASEVDISLSFYGNIERGTRIPSLESLVGIANKLGVSMDYLLAEDLNTPRAKGRYSQKDLALLRDFLQEQQNALDHWNGTPKE